MKKFIHKARYVQLCSVKSICSLAEGFVPCAAGKKLAIADRIGVSALRAQCMKVASLVHLRWQRESDALVR